FVRLESNKLEDVRLARYYSRDENYSNQVYCEAQKNNDRANKLCGKLLQGDELFTTSDNYKAYLIEGKILEGLCRQKLFWSNTNNTCYMTERDRCTAHGMSMVGSGTDAYCGYQNETDGNPVNEGGTCKVTPGSSHACSGITVKAGGTCDGTDGSFACERVTVEAGGVCQGAVCTGDFYGTCISSSVFYNSCIGMKNTPSTYHDGSVCVGNSSQSCFPLSADATITFEAGSMCIANVRGACSGADFSQGGCCCGKYCQAVGAPVCGTCNSEYIWE
ncbi:MAG: hypothetical protein IKO35_02145, partial [Elusimicrobiaceae bacterium]|nr:hypothetical protein [Elusimicrobiaceae bacterium]